ncbi:MAG: exo-alpha-sialidase [Firmicutes bacterium]|jgi:hypothetical protein|nr:exo-alpha-sialidase [Bacillota bacterium]
MMQATIEGHTEGSDFDILLTYIRRGFSPTHCWVHPKAGVCWSGSRPRVVLTTQELLLSGSDVFGVLHDTYTEDWGQTWTELREQSGFSFRNEPNGIRVGVCDFSPIWHKASQTMLGLGHTVRYKGNRLMPDPRPREPAYSVYIPEEASWQPWQTVDMPDPDRFFDSGFGCCQIVELPTGDLLIPMHFRRAGEVYRSVTVTRCAFDGAKLHFIEHDSVHRLNSHRGFLEPALTQCGDRFFLTLRAGDGRAYVSVSDDGMQFAQPRPWGWDDGEELVTGDTQQKWVTHGEGLYLVYTRVTSYNAHVMRHRAPLFIARADIDGVYPRLIRKTERVLVPEKGARLGNFQVTPTTPEETWVTVSEWMQPVGCEKYGSDNRLYVARLQWKE